jgi:hypothetical protein
MAIKLVRWNHNGTGWKSDGAERFAEFRVFASGGNIEVWGEFRLGSPSDNPEALQYLAPWQATRIGLGFIRAAFVAVWRARH